MQGEETPKPKRQRRAKSAPSELRAVDSAGDNPDAAAEEAPKKKRRAKGPDPDAYCEPSSPFSCHSDCALWILKPHLKVSDALCQSGSAAHRESVKAVFTAQPRMLADCCLHSLL